MFLERPMVAALLEQTPVPVSPPASSPKSGGDPAVAPVRIRPNGETENRR
jgi:hypothetical protein